MQRDETNVDGSEPSNAAKRTAAFEKNLKVFANDEGAEQRSSSGKRGMVERAKRLLG